MQESATVQWVALGAAVLLALVHVFARRLRNLAGMPRSRWLSLAGGASVAYVFIHLFPELSRGQQVLSGRLAGPLEYIESHIYLISLAGLAVFYGLEIYARRHQSKPREERGREGIFWVHVGSFTLYNHLIGYLLLHLEDNRVSTVILFSLAMGMHLLVNDFALRELHREDYHNFGRWMLAGTVLAGWGIGALTEISEVGVSILLAFLAGGIILNVLKEELPAGRESNYPAFLAGVVAFSSLLLAI